MESSGGVECKGYALKHYRYMTKRCLNPTPKLSVCLRVDLRRHDGCPTLLSPVQQESHRRSQLLQVQIPQEAPLKFGLHRVPAGAAAALQEHHGRLTQQPIQKLLHAHTVLIGQCFASPEAEMKHVGCHAGAGALQREKITPQVLLPDKIGN